MFFHDDLLLILGAALSILGGSLLLFGIAFADPPSVWLLRLALFVSGLALVLWYEKRHHFIH